MAGQRIRTGTFMSEQVQLKIEGMHCDACVRRVKLLLKRVGVEVERMSSVSVVLNSLRLR